MNTEKVKRHLQCCHSFPEAEMKVCQFSREGVQGGWSPAESRGRSGAGKGSPREPGILLSDGIHFPSRKVHLDVSVGGGGGLYLVPCCERDPGAQREGGWMRVGAQKEEI